VLLASRHEGASPTCDCVCVCGGGGGAHASVVHKGGTRMLSWEGGSKSAKFRDPQRAALRGLFQCIKCSVHPLHCSTEVALK
jgi:hypothetical protein